MTGLVVDTSAAIAMLTDEIDTDILRTEMERADLRLMSTATLIELGIVLEARIGPAGSGIVERFLRDGGIEPVPVDRTHVDRAMEGWRRFGLGRHRAALNFGDCFSYSLAAATGFPLLCTGTDFRLTDIDVLPAEAA